MVGGGRESPSCGPRCGRRDTASPRRSPWQRETTPTSITVHAGTFLTVIGELSAMAVEGCETSENGRVSW